LLLRIAEALHAATQLKEKFGHVSKELLFAKEFVPKLKGKVQEYSDATVSIEAKIWALIASAAAILIPLVAAKAEGLRATVDPEKRSSTAQAASEGLAGIERGLDHAIEAVEKLITFWSRLAVDIRATTSDQLLSLKRGVLKKCLRHWGEIEQQYSTYASTARLSKKTLEVRRAVEVKGAIERRPRGVVANFFTPPSLKLLKGRGKLPRTVV